jgi:hypothetical protein
MRLMLSLFFEKKYMIQSKIVVPIIRVKFKPKGRINLLLNKNLMAVKLIAKNIFVPKSARCGLMLLFIKMIEILKCNLQLYKIGLVVR